MKIISHISKSVQTILITGFWLCLWQAGAWILGNHILLVGPLDIAKALISLFVEADFWYSIAISLSKISLGFFSAFFSGIVLGWLAFFWPFFQDFLAPVIAFINSVPIASFVILALIWTGSENLSVLSAFLVAFPVIYVNTTAGLKSTDPKLLEMAKVFHMTWLRKLAGLYWPALLPYLASSCKTALGMSWKSGIAAEVIGVPGHTIGEQLYLSKIYLNTADLFAWTLVIILVSAAFERIFLALLRQTGRNQLFLTTSRTVQSKTHADTDSPLKTLTTSQLTKQFGHHLVLDQVNLSFTSESPNCVMGPSGSGKTTLFHILLGLENADAGLIKKTGQWELPTVAVFQEDRLCQQFSPVDNIRLAVPGLSRTYIIKELSRILPEECLDRPISTLSGGMKRRTAIARALLAPSDMIIMDEPFTGLDEATKEITIRYILEKSAGKLLILSTHQEEDILLVGGKPIKLRHKRTTI